MKVLITGGSGLIGSEISRLLLKKGQEVAHLSRNPEKDTAYGIEKFYWDPDKGDIDSQALKNCSAIVNLAGEPIFQRWTPENKSNILRSRVDSTRLLFDTIQKNKLTLQAFISASAAGYYPSDYNRSFDENDAPGSDFLSVVCQKWEQEAQNFEKIGIRTVRCRIGLVLSKRGGLLPLMKIPFRLGLGSALGNGRQWMPWINIQDLAAIFILALENEKMKGAYNACGPDSKTNRQFSETLARVMNRPFFMPPVPSVLLKLTMGEMAQMALNSNKISSSKIRAGGFRFRYATLEEALEQEI